MVVASVATTAMRPAAQLPAGSDITYHRSEAEMKIKQTAGHWQVADVMGQQVGRKTSSRMPTIERLSCIDKNPVIETACEKMSDGHKSCSNEGARAQEL